MYYIRLHINGVNKYLYNWRTALFLPDYARRFKSEEAARRYMYGKQVGKECTWWVVEEPAPKRYCNT
ncbi:hypothetical protein LI291_02180 [Intestinibacillus massiliensis]|uniref:hypothetical protein n=1 Tax=Intestinibacillus massiliensis TaxID=1871029 RepID=UPI000B35A5EE|nr:hypothetical protein [Intestinibacillus massiliensis]MCB6364999.1 hypothetical protein [Intestinibacillus massiliensis]